MRSRTGGYWLHLTIFVSCWVRALRVVLAGEVNVTIEDTNPSVIYLPSDAWFVETDQNSSFHLVRLPKQQRRSNVDKRSKPLPKRSSIPRPLDHHDDLYELPQAAEDVEDTNTWPLLSDSDELSSKRNLKLPRKKRASTPATLQFDFAGPAIYLFGFQPPAAEITYAIDGVTYPPQAHSNVTLFSQKDLSDGPHTLIINVGSESGFIFDYLIYTQFRPPTKPRAAVALPPSSSPSDSGSPISPPSATSSPDQKRNVTTFAAAIGGSVGVLALLSAGLAISIIRRRYKAAKREREDREASANDPERIRQQQMAMAGPDTFIPRFFPGTEIPPGDPPTYSDTVNADRVTSIINTTSPSIVAGAPVGPPGIATPPVAAGSATGHVLPNHIAYPYLLSLQLHMQQNYPYLHQNRPPPHHMHGHGVVGSDAALSYADIPPDTPPLSELALSDNEEAQRAPPVVRQPVHVDVGVGGDEPVGGLNLIGIPHHPTALGRSDAASLQPQHQGRQELGRGRAGADGTVNPTNSRVNAAAESVQLLTATRHPSAESIPTRRQRSLSR